MQDSLKSLRCPRRGLNGRGQATTQAPLDKRPDLAYRASHRILREDPQSPPWVQELIGLWFLPLTIWVEGMRMTHEVVSSWNYYLKAELEKWIDSSM
jgi:hypothetical protein